MDTDRLTFNARTVPLAMPAFQGWRSSDKAGFRPSSAAPKEPSAATQHCDSIAETLLTHVVDGDEVHSLEEALDMLELAALYKWFGSNGHCVPRSIMHAS